jgi:hypothetical protein
MQPNVENDLFKAMAAGQHGFEEGLSRLLHELQHLRLLLADLLCVSHK